MLAHLGWLGKDIGRKEFAGDCVDLLQRPAQMLIGFAGRHFPLGNESVNLVEHQHWTNVLQPRLPQHSMSLPHTRKQRADDHVSRWQATSLYEHKKTHHHTSSFTQPNDFAHWTSKSHCVDYRFMGDGRLYSYTRMCKLALYFSGSFTFDPIQFSTHTVLQ